MKRKIIQSALLAAALLIPVGLSLAAVDKAPAAGESKAISKAKAADKDAKAKKPKKPPRSSSWTSTAPARRS